MNIKIVKPIKLLSKYIKYFWIIEGNHQTRPELVYPTGEIQIILHFRNPFIDQDSSGKIYKQPQFAVYGQKTSYSNVFTNKETGTIGILFFPHAASAFFPFPIHEITDTMLDLSDIYRDWKQVENEYIDNISNQDRIDIVEQFLLRKIKITNSTHYSLIEACVKDINLRKGLVNIKELAEKYDLTGRTLQRIFKNNVGISAKQFSSFKKLENGVQLCKTENKLTESCFKAGYYDQADFIKTIKRYTGYTPSELKKIL